MANTVRRANDAGWNPAPSTLINQNGSKRKDVKSMNTAAKVNQIIEEMKKESIAKTVFVVRLANALIGWSYVFGGRGEYCSPANRRRFYEAKGKPTIKSKCKNFEGSGYSGCTGCKWYPGGCTRFFDCRGFTYWLFKQIGIVINGGGATSQYNDDSNWTEKGPIENMPRDKVCCVFRYDSSTKKMEHTLLYDGDGHYIHCSGEVKKCNISSYKATHYAIPKGLYGGSSNVTEPVQQPTDTNVKLPTLRKGSKGSYVTLLQTLLMNKGYKLPKYGADGDFGNETLEAVKRFQEDNGLTVDGVVGTRTWEMLEKADSKPKTYTVTLKGLTKEQAESLLKQYSGVMTQE